MKLRLLHVITTLGRGGAERQLVNLVCHTSREKFQHLVVYLHPPHDLAGELREAGHEVICLDLPRRAPWLFAPRRLKPILKKYQPHLIQTWLYEADFAVRLSTRGLSIPVVNTLHQPAYEPETITAGQWPNWKMQILRQIDRTTARWSKPLFVAVSETVRDSAIKQLGIPRRDVRVIYNAIDVDTLETSPDKVEQLRAELELPPEVFFFLNVGRMAPQKGQTFLLEAFQIVVNRFDNAYLGFAGDGPMFEELRKLTRSLGINHRVRFLGRREDIGTCLELADAFIFPSLFEGHPLALVEAMLKGVPCITTKIGAMEEIVINREHAILVNPRSPAELADAMAEILFDVALRERLAEAAQRMALERFDLRNTVRTWEELYRELSNG